MSISLALWQRTQLHAAVNAATYYHHSLFGKFHNYNHVNWSRKRNVSSKCVHRGQFSPGPHPTPGFSLGILRVWRKTSKSRKFGILNFECSADKCEPSLGNKKSCKIPCNCGVKWKNIHGRWLSKNCSAGVWTANLLIHKTGWYTNKWNHYSTIQTPWPHSVMMWKCKQLAFINTDV